MALEITDIGPQHLVVEEKPPLGRLVLVSIAGAGLLLTLGTIKEYGWQSWYRLTYWLGALVALLAGAGWVVWGRSTRTEVRLAQRRLYHRQRRGLLPGTTQQVHLSRVQGLDWETQAGTRPRYRLWLVQTDGSRMPLSHRFTPDEAGLRSVAARLQAYLDQVAPQAS